MSFFAVLVFSVAMAMISPEGSSCWTNAGRVEKVTAAESIRLLNYP